MFFTRSRETVHLQFDKAAGRTGLSVVYDEHPDERSQIAVAGGPKGLGLSFPPDRVDESHILYMEATEILYSRAEAGESAEAIFAVLEQLFEKFA